MTSDEFANGMSPTSYDVQWSLLPSTSVGEGDAHHGSKGEWKKKVDSMSNKWSNKWLSWQTTTSDENRRWPPARCRPPSTSNGRLLPSTSVEEGDAHHGSIGEWKKKVDSISKNKYKWSNKWLSCRTTTSDEFADGRRPVADLRLRPMAVSSRQQASGKPNPTTARRHHWRMKKGSTHLGGWTDSEWQNYLQLLVVEL